MSSVSTSVSLLASEQPSSFDVRQAPWTKYLSVTQGSFSSEDQRYRIMLAARGLTMNSSLLEQSSKHEEPLAFARDAGIVFARLPSGYFALIVMIKTEEPEAEDEYLKVIFTSAVSFSFSEDPRVVTWVKDRVKCYLRPGSEDVFWALVRCIELARRDRECDPVLRLAQEEIVILQHQLDYMERMAFLTVLEQSMSEE